ncbi:MAG: HIT domain-containing protein [bacterium]|nr:HIT domain-containing protein [bacterium]
MKTLWTPWRMEHVEGSAERTYGCIFEPPGETTSDKEHLLLLRSPLLVVLLNRFPYANGHLLVGPRRHVAEITELTGDEQGALMALLGFAAQVLRLRFHAEGINIGLNLGVCAGAGIPGHLHFHVVPRWPGDHNFMTVLADVRTIPQHIERSFDLLLPDFQQYLAQKDYVKHEEP